MACPDFLLKWILSLSTWYKKGWSGHTLAGWEQYEAEKRGLFKGNYGFIAMQFGNAELDDFVRDVVKPEVKNATGCDLVTLHDVATAGVIDNILRVKIRDAKFVIADLTHDNRGAYW